MANCICIMMQKNEILLEPWLLYHGSLFGFENLHVYDNGSSQLSVLEVLRRYEKLGVHVSLDHKSPTDFSRKGEIIAELIAQLQADKEIDFFFPLDCDEFVTLSGETGISTSRNEIHNYLDSMVSHKAILHVSHSLINIPGRLDVFAMIDFSKSIIPNKPLYYLDHGFHSAQLRDDTPRLSSRIYYAHLHNKPFAMLVQSAREKLSPFVDCDDLEALEKYDSNGSHLVRYFFDFKIRYAEQYSKSARLKFAGLQNIFEAYTLTEFMRLWAFEAPAEDTPENTPTCIVSGIYSRTNYMLANPDVAQSQMDPLTHFIIFGYREGRPVKPV